MNYQELKNALKQFKSEGLTEIRLNASKAELQAEYDRLVKNNNDEVKVSSRNTKESYDTNIVHLEENQPAISELKEHEQLINDEVVKVEHNEEEHSHPDHEISDLLDNAYREIEDDSNDVNSPSKPKFESLIFAVLIVISIIGLIFATEKFISNLKFVSEMYKFSF